MQYGIKLDHAGAVGRINLSPADTRMDASEVEDLERVVAELEEFGQGTPWMDLQVQPADKKA